MNTWSEKLIQQTRKELDDMLSYTDSEDKIHWLIGSFDLEKACFKNIDGERFGFMSAADAHARHYIIELNGGGREQYPGIDELIEAGWVLD